VKTFVASGFHLLGARYENGGNGDVDRNGLALVTLYF
jgi:hypothetical protein